jgi:hypothetical protein
VEDVTPKPPLIGGRMSRLVDAAIDTATEMLNEGTKKSRIGFACGEVPIDHD